MAISTGLLFGLLVAMIARALYGQAKASAALQAQDARCHYIYLGAKPDQLSALWMQPGCVDWHSFVREKALLESLKRYRQEVRKAWPEPPEWLAVELEKIDEK
jgi:hypothetical protein